MDYEDTDFQSQNFELKSEETNNSNNKFPSILRPFSLPKFEIEDHHLSLNEAETLFTIPNLSHSSNWIHDSISRTKNNNSANVWSEATSTESVEMLLNSVTEQDERVKNNDNNNNNNMDGHDVHDMDYSHIMDVDPSSSILEESKSKSNVLEECITEQNPLEDSRRSDGLLESITYPIRNLGNEMHGNFGITNQFGNVNVGYPQIGKQISEEMLNIRDVSEKSQVDTESKDKESTEESVSAKIVDGTTGSVEVLKEMEAQQNNERDLVSKETVLSQKDVESSVSLTGTSTGTGGNIVVEDVDPLLKSQSAELAPAEEGLLASDTIKDQSSSDQIGGETIEPVSVQDSIKSSDSTVLKEKEKEPSLDPIEMPVIASVASIDDSSPKLPAVQEEEAGNEEKETVVAPSTEENPSSVISETKLEHNVETNTSSAEKESQEANPNSDAAKDNNPANTNTPPGSPTIISCSQSCLEEEAKESEAPSELVSKEKSEEGSKESVDDKSFSFNVVANVADERETAPDWKPFHSLKSPKSPDIGAVAKESSPNVVSPPEKNNSPKNPTESTEIMKMPSTEAKTKTKAETPTPTPEPSQKKRRERKKNPSLSSPLSPPLSPPSTAMHLESMKKHPGFQEGSSKSAGKSAKSKMTPISSSSSSSGLPDLNASDSAPHQPFTDLQHVQLRAQIFVYGSLIQGVPPAEAYMASAFGDSDGGRAKWEGAWRTAVEKNQIPKSPSSAIETPTNSRSAQRTTESIKETPSKKKSTHSSSRAGTKSQSVPTQSPPIAPALTSPTVPSPISRGTQLDFTQSVPPISPIYNPYQPLQMKSQSQPNISPWLSPAPHSNPWGIKTGTVVSTVPTTTITTVEPSKMTPRRRNPPSSPVVLLASSFPVTDTPVTASPVPTDAQKSVPVPVLLQVSNVTPPTQKTRKRKKASSSAQKEPDNNNQSQTLPPPLATLPPPLATLPPPSVTPSPVISPPLLQSLPPVLPPHKILFHGQLASSTSLIPTPQPSNHALPAGTSTSIVPTDQSNKSISIFSEDANSRIENSKLQAEEAAMHAAAAVKYSQGVWSHLSANRNSTLTSDAEQKLTSAAAAAAAAASVAKAAALAAKLASEAALQAKIMAEEAIRTGQIGQQGGQPGQQGSFIAFAREAAKKRVEEASAAAKRAQNLDAVIKAAEVAAQAVSQAGVVVAMGDPLPLGIEEMLENLPEGFWKGYFGNSEKERGGIGGGSRAPLLLENREKDGRNVGNLQLQRTEQGNESGDKDKAGGNKDKAAVEPPKEILDGITKGSHIEVLADEAGLRGVWFGASVLDIEENRMLVCYTDRFADEGLGQRREWISARSDPDSPPRIRKAHPMMVGYKPEGTRKRRREAVGTGVYAVGDHVDAWIRDGWRQGIITEKIDGDTKFTVQFQGAGGSSIVEAWHLRPTLVWKDGQWSLWVRPHSKKTHPKESESPYEKRQRLGHLAPDTTNQAASTVETSNPSNSKKPESSKPFSLPTVNEEDNDEIFTVGKFTMGETKTSKRTSTQKEGGSRVVFGVPKPGKKRKFMEVSKHFSEKSAREENPNPNPNPNNPPGKSAHYSMPQNRAPKTKGKETAEPKPKTGVKSIKNTHQNGNQSSSSFDSLAEQRAPLSSLVGALKEKKKLEQDLGAKRKNVSVEVGNEKESVTDSSEPRRSNRRIQPTNRLLEGLQSSLILAKIPSDKGARGAPKGASSKGRP
ncbi:hypothetical protein LUZ60_014424 [Juncus effusus]|nr:hypothetical protein LUZ60_014424 [Juncus effusus]